MQQIKPGIYFEDQHLGVTLGALVYSHGTVLIDAPLRPEDARSWRSGLLSQRGGIGRLLVLLDAHPDRSLGARSLESTILVHQETGYLVEPGNIKMLSEAINYLIHDEGLREKLSSSTRKMVVLK